MKQHNQFNNETETTQHLEHEDSKSAMLMNDQKEKLVNKGEGNKQSSFGHRRDTPEVNSILVCS